MILRQLSLRAGLALALLLALCTPLLHAHSLYVCKDASPSTALAGRLFTFHVSGGHLASTVVVSVPVGGCTFVANGPNLTYTVSEDDAPGTVLTSVWAAPSNSLATWTFPQRSARVEVLGEQSTYVHFVNSVLTELSGRWTGGGSIFTNSGERVTHGFELHCDASVTPNRLEINFGGDRFHLTSLTSAYCFINSAGVPEIIGSGTGEYNGNTGYHISFVFTDAGEPGIHDYASYVITGPNSQTILSVAGNLDHGNQDYHKQ